MTTRIVAGSAGGRRIEVPPRGTRPTTDRVREAIFSALESSVGLDDARVLDLYSGSGSLGLECLSRGAAHVTFVEADRRAAGILRRNISLLGFDGVRVEQATVDAVLARTPERPYDLVLADPPYALDDERFDQVCALLPRHGWTTEGSVVITERSARGAGPEWSPPLTATREKRYGETVVYWALHSEPDVAVDAG